MKSSLHTRSATLYLKLELTDETFFVHIIVLKLSQFTITFSFCLYLKGLSYPFSPSIISLAAAPVARA